MSIRVGVITASAAVLAAGLALANHAGSSRTAGQTASSAAAAQQQGCPRFVPVDDARRIGNLALVEASGLVASAINPEVLWSHNDSGAPPVLFALSTRGEPLAEYSLEGATAVDWEDIAIGPGPEQGRPYLYVGDIGNNHHRRASVAIYRIEEPKLPPGPSLHAQRLNGALRIDLVYADDGWHDAEALVVDPRTAEIYLITKSLLRTPEVYRAALGPDGKNGVLELVASVRALARHSPFTSLVTAADVSRDGRWILVRTYYRAFLFPCDTDRSLAECLEASPCEVPLRFEIQGESIAFAADGSGYFTTSEGRFSSIHWFRREP